MEKVFSFIFMKLLQDLANRESKDEAELKQYKEAKDIIRKNELRMKKAR